MLSWVLCGLSSLKMFSNCSKQSIYKTIESKSQECFQERSNKVCGNSRVDEGEECDPGIMYLNNDTCCNSDCTLRPGVQCRWGLRHARRAGAQRGMPRTVGWKPGPLESLEGLWKCVSTPVQQKKCFLESSLTFHDKSSVLHPLCCSDAVVQRILRKQRCTKMT